MSSNVSPAIIMRVKEFGESDLLVSFFTADKGRLKGVAKGARKSRRRFANCLDLFCLANIEYELKGRGELYFLYSGKLVHAFPAIRSDFSALSLASYMIELTEILFPPQVADRNMFELLRGCLFALSEGAKNDRLRVIFEAKAMALGGYGIDLDRCCKCLRSYTGEGRAVFLPNRGGICCPRCGHVSALSPGLSPDALKGINIIQSGIWDTIKGVPLLDELIGEIAQVLALHIEYRVGRRLKSAEYLK